MEFVKDRLIVLDAAESASHAKLEGLRADYKAAPVEERVDLRRELDEARARYKTVRSQIIALEAVLGAAAGRDRLEKLEREEGELEAKLEAIHQAWKDLPKGRDWEENAIEAEVKELWEEYDECTSRQYKLQDILDKAAGGSEPTAAMAVESIQKLAPEVPASRRSDRLRSLERRLDQILEERAALRMRQGEIARASRAVRRAGVGNIKKDVYCDYLLEEYEAARLRVAVLEDELSARAGGAVDVVSYLERFPKLPALMSFGDFCAVFPYPPEDPLWSFTSAKGLIAALIIGAIARFMGSLESGPMISPAAATVQRLVGTVSKCYLDPSNTSYSHALEETMGPNFVGPKLESVATMMDRVQDALLQYLSETTRRHVKMPCKPGQLETTRIVKLQEQDASSSSVTILILEGRAEKGAGTDPVQAIRSAYARETESLSNSSAQAETLLPAIGVEVNGCDIRFHALCFTDRVCCKPMTPSFHFLDLWTADPQYMERLVRTMHAFGVLFHDLYDYMAPYTEAHT
ncbi:g7051 [Coccomyxa viridis]|uniref:G7051 protein n=1 Tax=Coccomyxa viridis TaxID=1274662 RepID=A0ABP1FZC6_9CHLO